jgi:hypothetical protein
MGVQHFKPMLRDLAAAGAIVVLRQGGAAGSRSIRCGSDALKSDVPPENLISS